MGRHTFALENLEGRALFSVVAPHLMAITTTPALVAAVQSTIKHPHPLQAAFNVSGTYTHTITHIGNPDVSTPYEFTGTGKTDKVGAFTLTGWLQTPGFIQNGQSYGKLWLTNDKGSIILKVSGPPQQPGVLPTSLSFSIYKGHGAFLHSKGTGQILVSASDTTSKFVFRFNQSA